MTVNELKKALKKLDKKYDDFKIEVDDNCGGGYSMTKIEILTTDQGTEIICIS